MSNRSKINKILQIIRNLDPKKRLTREDKRYVVSLLEKGLV